MIHSRLPSLVKSGRFSQGRSRKPSSTRRPGLLASPSQKRAPSVIGLACRRDGRLDTASPPSSEPMRPITLLSLLATVALVAAGANAHAAAWRSSFRRRRPGLLLLAPVVGCLWLTACRDAQPTGGLPAECETYIARYRDCLAHTSRRNADVARDAENTLRERLTAQLATAQPAELRRTCVADLPGLAAACR